MSHIKMKEEDTLMFRYRLGLMWALQEIGLSEHRSQQAISLMKEAKTEEFKKYIKKY